MADRQFLLHFNVYLGQMLAVPCKIGVKTLKSGYKTYFSMFSLLEYWELYVAPPGKVTQASSLRRIASRMLAVLWWGIASSG
jgi:hypothetical protein